MRGKGKGATRSFDRRYEPNVICCDLAILAVRTQAITIRLRKGTSVTPGVPLSDRS